MRITGTFLDEISHDIPHQNWGREEWEHDFQAMKAFGINTVILIRCGWKRWMTYPSAVLMKEKNGFEPPVDLIGMFLDLAEKYGMDFYCGSYDSGIPWWRPEYDAAPDIEIMSKVCNEIIDRYGERKAFKGWYFSQEIDNKNSKVAGIYRALSAVVKARMPEAKIMISPSILGANAYNENMEKLGVTIAPEQHEAEWKENMEQLKGVVDIVAFQDGLVEIELLPTFLEINKRLCDENGIECWSNVESFDRDMPIDFLPIKWEKLRLKLKAAEEAGLSNAIT
ncbi:MAG: DUF4434 domain-containing protein, partial [Lentisphaerae bacterium]|nr:DUF4434 domain-containing protein [Lentisphaerota bacterium]